MPYKNIKNLPDSIKQKLSIAAQQIYLEAFNQYFAEFSKLEPRSHTNLPLEEKVHKAALAVVELKFPKQKP